METNIYQRLIEISHDSKSLGKDAYRIKAKSLGSEGKHVPNKNEAKTLRRLMSQTGLNEAELRSNIKYKRILAASSKSQENTGWLFRKYNIREKDLIKRITKELKLAKEHPLTVQRIREEKAKIKFPYSVVNY